MKEYIKSKENEAIKVLPNNRNIIKFA